MNAPATERHLKSEFDLLPLTAIAPSETQVQKERRGRYNAAALDELAQSIREQGLLQPVVVRPLAALRGLAKYELIAGERRWLACEKAGLAHVLARVVTLDDAQVLKAQLVENLQREGLDVMAEAVGYRELLDSGVPADAIGNLVGKSRSYVYARIKLLELCPEARKDLDNGVIDASKALLLARFRSPKLQKQALKILAVEGEYYSYRRLVEKLQRFMADLAKAPFDLADKTLGEHGPKEASAMPLVIACLDCSHNSRNDPELQADLDAEAHVCTHAPCYEHKATMHFHRRRAAAEAAGQTVIAGEEARKIVQRWGGLNGYVDLDEEADPHGDGDDLFPEPDDTDSEEWKAWDQRYRNWKPPTWRQLLGKAAPKNTVLIEHPHEKGQIIEAVPAGDVRAAVKAAKLKIPKHLLPDDYAEPMPEERNDPAQRERYLEQQKREEERREKERAFRQRLLQEIAARWKGPLKRDDLYAVADQVVDGSWSLQEISKHFYDGKALQLGQMNEAELVKFIVVATARHEVGAGGKPGRLLALAKRLGIKPEKVREALEPKDAPPPKKKATKGKGKKK